MVASGAALARAKCSGYGGFVVVVFGARSLVTASVRRWIAELSLPPQARPRLFQLEELPQGIDSETNGEESVLCPCQFLLKVHDLFDLHQEPPVHLGEVENLLGAEAGAQGVADEEDAFGVGHAQFAADDVAREDVAVAIDFRADAPGFAVAAQAAAANLQRAQAFLQAFLERAADGD